MLFSQAVAFFSLTPSIDEIFFNSRWLPFLLYNYLFYHCVVYFMWPQTHQKTKQHLLFSFHKLILLKSYYLQNIIYFNSVQSLRHVRLFATPWTAARQASLSIINLWSPPKPVSIESVMPCNHLILCCPLLLLPPIPPSIRVFSMSHYFPSGGQSIRVSASASVLPMNTQDWSPLGWTGWMSLQSKGLSRVFSNTTVQKHQFFGTQLSL